MLGSSETFEVEESRDEVIARLLSAGQDHGYKVRLIHKTNGDYVVVSRPWRPKWPFRLAVVAFAFALVALLWVWGWFFWIGLALLCVVCFALSVTRTEATTYFVPAHPDEPRCTVTAKRSLTRPLASPLL